MVSHFLGGGEQLGVACVTVVSGEWGQMMLICVRIMPYIIAQTTICFCSWLAECKKKSLESQDSLLICMESIHHGMKRNGPHNNLK